MLFLHAVEETRTSASHCLPFAPIWRSGRVESAHRKTAVTDRRGPLIAGVSDPEFAVLSRSAAKLRQAITRAAVREIDGRQLAPSDAAITCGLDNSGPEQVACMRSIPQRIGTASEVLRWGLQEPYRHDADGERFRRGADHDATHNTCSGNSTSPLGLTRPLLESIEEAMPARTLRSTRWTRVGGIPSDRSHARIRRGLREPLRCEVWRHRIRRCSTVNQPGNLRCKRTTR